MKIYKVTRTDLHWSYDLYDSFICVAPDMETAKNLIPYHNEKGILETRIWGDPDNDELVLSPWVDNRNSLKVELLGIADATLDKTQILLASFNAG